MEVVRTGEVLILLVAVDYCITDAEETLRALDHVLAALVSIPAGRNK